MLLAIDIGNTNTVFAVFDERDELVRDWRCETRIEEYDRVLQEVDQIDAVIVSSVVPDTNAPLSALCQQHLSASPVFVTKDNVGVAIDLEKPDEVGADRLVNALAVITEYQVPAIVIDFGTATTFDVIDAKGAYAGGVIAPGINLSLSALEQAAAKLPGISIEKPDQAIGKDTVSAMQSGIYYGYKGLIEGIVHNISEEMGGAAPFVIATGGLARLFADNMPLIKAVDQALTIKGLLKIYKEKQS